MQRFNLTILTLAAALAAGSALAADTGTPPAGGPGGPGHGHFMKVDTNGDGFISKDEWRAKGDALFNEIDTNHDGKISPEEMRAHHEAMRAKWKEHRAEHGGHFDGKGPQGNPPAGGDDSGE